jgi:hypothetical protein
MLHEQQAPAPPPPVAAALPSAPTNEDDDAEESVTTFRDIHPLTPDAAAPTPPTRAASWDTASRRSFASSEEQYMTMSREFTAMVAAGGAETTDNSGAGGDPLASIGEDETEETNPLAIIVPDSHPIATPARSTARPPALDLEVVSAGGPPVEASRVKKEEVETKVAAWQTAEMAKINNRFKREEIVINGWETEQLDKASAWLKKIEVIITLIFLHRRDTRFFFFFRSFFPEREGITGQTC